MSIEEDNKAKVRRIIEEALNKGNMAVVDEILTPNFVCHSAADMPDIEGPGNFKKFISSWRNALPDLHLTIDKIFADGEDVAVSYLARGTFKNALGVIPPTGKEIEWLEVDICHFKDGKEAEVRLYCDELHVRRQLGVIPPQHNRR